MWFSSNCGWACVALFRDTVSSCTYRALTQCLCCPGGISADNPEFKRRIVTALGLLVGAKLLTVQVSCLAYRLDIKKP